MKVAGYPPVSSKTLVDAVAISEPPITVKVISAILVEKFFIPKNDDVNAAVIVGHAPYDIPVKQSPTIQSGSEPTETAIRVTDAARIVKTFEQIIVFLLPIAS